MNSQNPEPGAEKAYPITPLDDQLWQHLLNKISRISYLQEVFNLSRSSISALGKLTNDVKLLHGVVLSSFQPAAPEGILLDAIINGETPDINARSSEMQKECADFARKYWTAAAMQALKDPHHACGIFGLST